MNFLFDEDIRLENDFALLRPIDKADINNLLPVATKDKDLLQFSAAQIFTRELLKAYIDKAVENKITKNAYAFIVFDKTANQFAGSTSFLNISNPNISNIPTDFPLAGLPLPID